MDKMFVNRTYSQILLKQCISGFSLQFRLSLTVSNEQMRIMTRISVAPSETFVVETVNFPSFCRSSGNRINPRPAVIYANVTLTMSTKFYSFELANSPRFLAQCGE